ncbi:MAG: DUF805 domain-containing protein [Candidatus Poribacteria bacterium]|nr:DUF805 domain-containing protein [Candidatus Poribacteria bacterium]
MNFAQICFSFKGRVGRGIWWLIQVLIAIIVVILEAVDPELFDPDSLKVSHYLITLVVLAWIELAVAAKRWHDRNKSALWILFTLIPIIGQIWTVVELGFIKGTKGHNRFGPDPVRH